MLDVFNNDAFSIRTLTDAINKLKYVPRAIGSMGLFVPTSVSTTTITIEEQGGLLKLVSPSPRGAPGQTEGRQRRTVRPFVVPHFERNDAVYAEEVQNLRAFGSETAVEMLQGLLAQRFSIHTDAFDATEEYARVGALKGVVTYADGTTLNLFNEFGVSQISEVNFDLENASPTPGALRKLCASVVRSIQDELDGLPLQTVTALCSSDFFDDLISHPEVRDSYLGYIAAAELRGGYAYGTFDFGGIKFVEYRGKVGGTDFVAAGKCHIFPNGVPGLFRSYYAPADYIETVNTLGQRLYAKQYTMDNGKGVNLDVQMNALNICTRPRVLVQGKKA